MCVFCVLLRYAFSEKKEHNLQRRRRPLSTQDQQTVAEVEEGEELEDLDLAEGMDTAEGANNNDGLC